MKNWEKNKKFIYSTVKSFNYVSYLLLFFISGGLMFSCQNRPKEVLNRKQMERLMYDVYIAEATIENDYQNFITPDKKEAYINKVFAMHKTTQAQWDSSLSWYSDRIDLYLKMNDSVKARLQRAKQDVDAMMQQMNKYQPDPALVSQSYIPPFYIFSMPANTKRGFRFLMDSTEIFSITNGDDFQFRFSVVGIPPSFDSHLTSLLALVYSDTVIYKIEQIYENKTYVFPGVKYIPGDTLTQVEGFVHLHDVEGRMPHIQMYDISLGEKDSTLLVSDSFNNDIDIKDRKLMNADSVQLLKTNSSERISIDSNAPLQPQKFD